MSNDLCLTCGAYWDCEHQYTVPVMDRSGVIMPVPVLDFGFKPDLTVGQVIDDLRRDIGLAHPMCRSWLSPEMLADSAAQP